MLVTTNRIAQYHKLLGSLVDMTNEPAREGLANTVKELGAIYKEIGVATTSSIDAIELEKQRRARRMSQVRSAPARGHRSPVRVPRNRVWT